MVYRHSPLQLSFESFGAGLSTPLSSNNEWVQLAEVMPWKALDEAYQLEFTKNAGRAAKPFRLLYGAILIQQRMGLTDRGVVAAIRDTPALQYFIGLSEYKAVEPFNYSSLAHFRKRIADISELITNIMNGTRQDRSVGPIQSGHRHHGRNRSASQNQVSSRHRPPQPSKAES